MEYLLTCDCGKEHTVSKSQAGQEIPCECGQPLSVPTLRGLSQLPTAGQQSAAPQVSPRSTWTGWRGTAIAVASGLFVIASFAAGRFALQRYSVDTSYTADSAIAAGNEILEAYGPLDITIVWSEYATNGMGPKKRPDFYLWNKYARERTALAAISAGLAALFAAIAATIWITAPKSPKTS